MVTMSNCCIKYLTCPVTIKVYPKGIMINGKTFCSNCLWYPKTKWMYCGTDLLFLIPQESTLLVENTPPCPRQSILLVYHAVARTGRDPTCAENKKNNLETTSRQIASWGTTLAGTNHTDL
jgi:hypothetical protein